METGDFTLLYGGAAKFSYEMTPEEYKEASRKIMVRVREKAFSRGLPVYYGIKDKVIAEFSDGRKFEVEDQELVRPYIEDVE